MKQLNINRIKLLWLRMYAMRKKSILFSALGLFSGMLIFNVLTTFRTDAYSSAMLIIYYLVFCLYLSLNLASTFQCMQSKEGRIGFLALPATQLEKFIAYTLWAVIVPILAFLVSAAANDLLIGLITVCKGNLGDLQNLLFFSLLFKSSDVIVSSGQMSLIHGTPSILSWHLFSFSLYLAGACVWYKRVFLKTVIAIGICSFLLSLFVMGFISVMPEDNWFYNAFHNYNFESSLPWLNTIFVTVHLLLSFGLWWLGYRLFKRREVISQRVGWLGSFKK